MRDVVLRAEDVELVAGDDPVGHQALHGIHGNISVGQDGCLQLALHFLELDIIGLHGLVGQCHGDVQGQDRRPAEAGTEKPRWLLHAFEPKIRLVFPLNSGGLMSSVEEKLPNMVQNSNILDK